MKKSLFHKFIILVFILPALACGLFTDEATPEPEATEAVAATEAPAQPTDTAVPPTETAVPPTGTPEPTPTVDITAGFESYENEGLGLAFQYPADWSVEDIFFVLLASDQAILDAILNAPDELQDGAVVVLNADSTENLGDDPVSIVTDTFAEFDLSEDAAIVEGPNPVTIQGQDGAIGRIEGTSDETGESMVGLVFAVVNGDRAAAGLGFTTQEHEADYLPTIEAIFNTVVVSEPTETDPNIGGTSEPPTVESSVPLAVGDSLASSVEENSPRDFVFNGLAGSAMTFLVEPIDDNLDLVLEIFDADGNGLSRVDDYLSGESEEIAFSPQADGPYFLRVTDFFGEAGAFNITVTEGGAQTPTEAIPLASGEVVLGRLDGEPVSYLISGSAGVPATVFLIPEEELDATLTILGTDGVILVDEVDDGFPGETEAISFTPGADVDLIVTVDGFGDLRGGFAIFLVDPEAAFTAEGNVPDGGEQTYRVCVPANASPVVFVDPEEDFDVVVTLSDANGSILVDQNDNGFSGEPEAVVLSDDLTADTYYAVIITVDGFGSQGGNFTIIISSTSPDGVVVDGC